MQKSENRIWYAGAFRTPESIEKRKKRERDYKKTKSVKDKVNSRNRERYSNDNEYRERRKVSDKKYRDENKERINLKRKIKRRENREAYNAKNREYYNRDSRERFRIIRQARVRRNPLYGYTKIINQFKSGEIKFSDLVKRVSSIVDEVSKGSFDG